MILVDTSAWVEYDRATASPVDRRVAELITIDAQVAVTGRSSWRCSPGLEAVNEKQISGG